MFDISGMDAIEVATNMNFMELIVLRSDIINKLKDNSALIDNDNLNIKQLDALFAKHFNLQNNLFKCEETLDMYEYLFLVDDTFGINDYIS